MGRNLRAIDLYSGVGGWSLGLALAGIKVVASYELAKTANETNTKNNRHVAHQVDLRTFPLSEFPNDIDIVVGSPPCTQFSFANRGGNGNLVEGLADIRTFLAVVDHIRPRFWVMENVPRVARILHTELGPKGALRKFSHLAPSIQVISMEQFGLPQRRRRCIAGNIDFDLLHSYTSKLSAPTLGQVVKSLSSNRITDPTYGFRMNKIEIQDHDIEESLATEEIRINRASKIHHPIYNAMPFPDRLDVPSRTITATCTRVGRESVVIADPLKPGEYRRLTMRERACLQSFPLNFQFYSPFYRDKTKLIGNAMPPLIAFYIGQAIKKVTAEKLTSPRDCISRFAPPKCRPPTTKPASPLIKTLDRRRFKFAIPTLHLKSGVRFEFSNAFEDHGPVWRMLFFYGTSKEIRSISLDKKLLVEATKTLPMPMRSIIKSELQRLRALLSDTDSIKLQTAWAKKGGSVRGPLRLLDQLNNSGKKLRRMVETDNDVARHTIVKALNGHGPDSDDPVGVTKLLNNASLVAAGILIGSLTNSVLQEMDGRSTKPDRS